MITEKEQISNLLLSGMQTIPMFRINYLGKRLYCQEKPFKVYSGLTGALSCVTFKGNVESKRVNKWRDKMIDHLGREGQEAYLQTMADFGTLTHESIVRAWKDGFLDWKAEQEYAENFFRESALANKIEPNEMIVRQQVFEYCKAAASLLTFLHAEVSELYAVEGMAKTDVYNIATPVDIYCKLKSGKTATLNIKTSSQITDSHREQVAVEKFLWNETYANAEVTGIIRPKDWSMKKGQPTYELEILKADDETRYIKSVTSRLAIAMNDENNTYLNFPKEVSMFSGKTKLGETPIIETRTMEQVILGDTLTQQLEMSLEKLK